MPGIVVMKKRAPEGALCMCSHRALAQGDFGFDVAFAFAWNSLSVT